MRVCDVVNWPMRSVQLGWTPPPPPPPPRDGRAVCGICLRQLHTPTSLKGLTVGKPSCYNGVSFLQVYCHVMHPWSKMMI